MWTNLWVSHPAFRAAHPNRTAEGAPASCPYSMRTEPPTSLAEGLEPRVSGFLRGLAQLLGAPAPRSEVDSPTGVGFCKDRSTVSSARGIGTGTLSGPTGSAWGHPRTGRNRGATEGRRIGLARNYPPPTPKSLTQSMHPEGLGGDRAANSSATTSEQPPLPLDRALQQCPSPQRTRRPPPISRL